MSIFLVPEKEFKALELFRNTTLDMDSGYTIGDLIDDSEELTPSELDIIKSAMRMAISITDDFKLEGYKDRLDKSLALLKKLESI